MQPPRTKTPVSPVPAREPVLIDLALQGGGSHGAFTWGVLDRLLEEPWLKIDGISGTSAGAMNAAVLVDGYAAGGAEGARKALDSFWQRVRRAARFSPFRASPVRPCCSAAGRSTIRRSISRWTCCGACSRPTTSTRWASIRSTTFSPSASISTA